MNEVMASGRLDAFRGALKHRLPPRYSDRPRIHHSFQNAVEQTIRPGMRILDVGAGRRPSLQPNVRPVDATYIGLDVSERELAQAPEGSYDELLLSDLSVPLSIPPVDLVVSWWTFEHLPDLPTALRVLHQALRPNGRLVAAFPNRRAVFAVANRLLPHRVSRRVIHGLRLRPKESVFPAHYSHCSYDELRTLGGPWHRFAILPHYCGANYFLFNRVALALYLSYEQHIYNTQNADLAPFFLVVADK